MSAMKRSSSTSASSTRWCMPVVAERETVLRSKARDTGVRVAPISIGPKLSAGSWPGLALRWPLLVRRLRDALRTEAPYDVLMVHYKKEQLLVPHLPADLRRAVVWAEWGPVPF